MSEFAGGLGPDVQIHYTLGSDGQFRVVTKDTSEEVMARFGSIPVVDIVYMYPPIGAQHVNMGRALWEESTHFKEAILACDAVARPLLPQSIVEVMYPDACDQPMYEEVIQTAQYALPCLFAFQFALTAMWEAEGCAPSYVIGHSLGEYMAAVASGVLGMPLAMALVCERATLMHATVSSGAMMAVKASADAARDAIMAASAEGAVTVAAMSSHDATTLSGEWGALSRVLKQLPAGTKTARVKGSHADHSPIMRPIATELEAKAAALYAQEAPAPPVNGVEWWSSVTGGRMVDEAADSAFWGRQALEPVRFVEAMVGILQSHADKVSRMGTSELAPFETSRECVAVEMGEGMLTRFGEAIMRDSAEGNAAGGVALDAEFRSTLSAKDGNRTPKGRMRARGW